jgi:hypothetical protein
LGFWNCLKHAKDKYNAYTTGSGKDCYRLAKNFQPVVKRDFKHWECPWCKKIKSAYDTAGKK